MPDAGGWSLQPGQRIRRKDLHDRFGGNRQGGISPSAQTPDIFIFTGASGLDHGYVDRLREDGAFHYTGQGRTGDQVLAGPNLALLMHRRDQRALRVFLGVSDAVTYVGEFEFDAERPFYLHRAPSSGGGPERSVFVFRLLPTRGALANLLVMPQGPRPEDANEPGDLGRGPWSRPELQAASTVYAEMLEKELRGELYEPQDVIASVAPSLLARSSAAIARKLRAISSVLDQQGHGWIDRYEPLDEHSADLRMAVMDSVGSRSHLVDYLLDFEEAAVPPPAPHRLATDDVLVPTPSARTSSRTRSAVTVTGSPMAALRDLRKRHLGKAGESWVVGLEVARLERLGLSRLASSVRWVADLDGDGAGYDVRSFYPDGRERLIEVKTTNLSVRTPFYITSWEVDFSTRNPETYSLYRVHGFHRDPRLYVLDGSVEVTSKLEPHVFMGLPK